MNYVASAFSFFSSQTLYWEMLLPLVYNLKLRIWIGNFTACLSKTSTSRVKIKNG